ncbi:hypothetical protein A464_2937 [Salmonella bongori N268-08]|uniref:Uncharacterized protein n=1 Tax=Salmonella bongori N268-08 TaxID=1197719 RepID=S5MTR6_SALBN|nr:hypothetical protein A464_2937 [Salmonella bongori N268-08]
MGINVCSFIYPVAILRDFCVKAWCSVAIHFTKNNIFCYFL